MSKELHTLIGHARESLVSDLARRLSGSVPAYEEIQGKALQDRLEVLVDTLVEATDTRPRALSDYIEDIAGQRIHEGIFLGELQWVLSLLEDSCWRLVADNVPLVDQVPMLGRLSYTVGAAKDRLARVYLDRSTQAEMRAARLELRMHELFKGTISSPIEEGDMPWISPQAGLH